MASRRTQRTSTERPFSKTIKFNASTGEFEYYDKVTKENIAIEELEFTPLVTKNRLSGFSNQEKAQVLSNYIENSKEEEFKAFVFRNGRPTNLPELTGLWEDIKDAAKGKQIHFTQAIIGLAVLNGVEEIVEFIVYKSSLSSWIEIGKNTKEDVMSSKLVLTKGRLMRKGTGTELVEVTKKEQDEIDKKLAKNPRANVPITFYEIIATEATELSKKELAYTDEKITLIDEYFDAQSGASRTSNNREERSADVPDGGDDDDDLPF